MPLVDRHPPCPELEAFALGRLDDAPYAAVEEHVAACADCEAAVSRTAGDTFTALLQSARSLSDTPRPLASDLTALASIAIGNRTGPWKVEDGERSVDLPAALANHPRYRPVRQLGSGGMGTVWLAEHRVMGRQVAVKVIRPEFVAKAGAAERFRRETQAAAMLAHPNIVTAFDADQTGDTTLLAMEYIDGVSLADELRRHGPLPVAAACDAVRQAALGLQHAHERGLVHRDVKPQNLMRTADGVVKVLDFGLAVLADVNRAGGLTDGTVIMGTPDYIAPEQAEDARTADVRSDIYSLGCTLYHLLTGRVPFGGDSVLRKLDAHRSSEPESVRKLRPEVNAALAAVVAKMMAKQPANRYQTPGEVAAVLATSAIASAPTRQRRRPWLAVAAALLFTGIVIAAGVVYRIQTDNGEVVINVESPDVEIVLLKGGKEIVVIDTKTSKRVTVPTGAYDVVVKDKPDGIEVKTDKIVVLRGKEVLVTIERIERTEKPVPVAPERAADSINPLHRIRWAADSGWYDTAVTPDGRYFFVMRGVSGSPKSLRVWDTASGKLIFEREVLVARFTPDSTHLITSENSGTHLHVYDLATGRLIRSFDTKASMYNFHPAATGTRLLYYSPNGEGGQIWDWSTGKKLCDFPMNSSTGATILTPDGLHLFQQPGGKPPLRVLDASTGKEVDVYRQLRALPLGGLYTDGKALLCQDGRNLRVYDVATGQEVKTRDLGLDEWLTTSGDGRRLLMTSNMRDELRIVDTMSGQLLGRLHFPELVDTKRIVAHLSEDGRYAVVGGLTDSVYVFRRPIRPRRKRSARCAASRGTTETSHLACSLPTAA